MGTGDEPGECYKIPQNIKKSLKHSGEVVGEGAVGRDQRIRYVKDRFRW